MGFQGPFGKSWRGLRIAIVRCLQAFLGAVPLRILSAGLPVPSEIPLLMLIDTHAHLYLDAFTEDLEAVIERARAIGVERMLLPAIDLPSIHSALALCERFDGLYAMAALHPCEVKEASEQDFEVVATLSEHERVVAIGETGLDYHWDRSFDDRQQQFLHRHVELATERRLPLVLHNRKAFDDLIGIVEESLDPCVDPSQESDRLRGVFHCFTGTPEEARRVIRAGFAVGIGGVLTFRNANLAESVRDIPLDRIVLETDAPYLAPMPHRGRRNEPAYVRLVAERLAAAKGLPVWEVAEVTSRTARRIFGKMA